MPSKTKIWVRTSVAICVFIFALLFLFRSQVLTSFADLITTTSDPDFSGNNLAVLLMGDHSGERAQAAVNFAAQYPSTSIVIGPEEQTTFINRGYAPPGHLVHKKYLIDAGVSEASIIIPDCLNTSTFDEAICVRRLINQRNSKPDSLVIITSWYHSTRAKWIFEKVFQGTGIKIKAYKTQTEQSSPTNWWTREQSFLAVFNEYLKWGYWLTRTDVKYSEP